MRYRCSATVIWPTIRACTRTVQYVNVSIQLTVKPTHKQRMKFRYSTKILESPALFWALNSYSTSRVQSLHRYSCLYSQMLGMVSCSISCIGSISRVSSENRPRAFPGDSRRVITSATTFPTLLRRETLFLGCSSFQLCTAPATLALIPGNDDDDEQWVQRVIEIFSYSSAPHIHSFNSTSIFPFSSAPRFWTHKFLAICTIGCSLRRKQDVQSGSRQNEYSKRTMSLRMNWSWMRTLPSCSLQSLSWVRQARLSILVTLL